MWFCTLKNSSKALFAVIVSPDHRGVKKKMNGFTSPCRKLTMEISR